MMSAVRHPIFARVYERLSRSMERDIGDHRDDLRAAPVPVEVREAAAYPRKARLQERIDRSGIWPRVAGGCHRSRDTMSAIESAGFAVERVRSFDLGPSWSHTNPHVLGLARSPRAFEA